jgi:hypothetical protein
MFITDILISHSREMTPLPEATIPKGKLRTVYNECFNNIRSFEERHVDIGYLLFSKEAFIGTDLAISDKIRGLRSTAEVINSGTL